VLPSVTELAKELKKVEMLVLPADDGAPLVVLVGEVVDVPLHVTVFIREQVSATKFAG